MKKTACRGLGSVMGGSCPDDDGGGDGAADEVNEGGSVSAGGQPDNGTGGASDYVVPAAPVETVETYEPGEGFPLTRMVPEQLSNNIVSSVNFGADPDELRYQDDYSGQTIDYFLVQFGVPLGGIDFITASRRDPATKAQTLLVARVVASRLAGAAVWKEWQKDPEDRVVFTKCDLQVDRPWLPSDASLSVSDQAAARASEARWAAQVEELFFRFYARPPSKAELAAVREAFVAVVTKEGYSAPGWVAVLYALLASEEFWHV